MTYGIAAELNRQKCRIWTSHGQVTKLSMVPGTRKLKHANSILLEYFEYFCQMSLKSILIILSYTVSKFAHFFRDTV